MYYFWVTLGVLAGDAGMPILRQTTGFVITYVSNAGDKFIAVITREGINLLTSYRSFYMFYDSLYAWMVYFHQETTYKSKVLQQMLLQTNCKKGMHNVYRYMYSSTT